MEQHKDLQIPLKEIASNTFHKENYLGGGGFGAVYKGELSRFKERGGVVAFKKLDRMYGQGETEFFKEIEMLSQYKHENIITLLGYCKEGKELILVYEYASNGSLDSRLDSPHLTWAMRLKICLQAAKGLRYLHGSNESHLRVIHRDIKSANILLDDEWNAKVSDFGLSKISHVNTNLVTYASGTAGYSDPQYYRTYTLTEKSDVYSFGVTLFEVLCGRLCYDVTGNNELLVFVHKWMERYEQNKIKDIIFEKLDMEQIDVRSLKIFSGIAYQCLKESRQERPTMAEVVTELEVALEAQEDYDMILQDPVAKKYIEIVRSAVSPVKYRSIEELKERLSEGVLVNGGKTMLSINEKGEHIERIYIQSCLNLDEIKDYDITDPSYFGIVNSRFPGGKCYYYMSRFKACVRGEYLTPHISYTLNLVFREELDINKYNPVRYKIDGEDETKVFIIYPSIHMREDGWLIVPLYHFTTQHTTADLQFQFEDRWCILLVAGFEFQPCEEKVELQVFEEYQHIVEAASQSLFYTSLDELKQILSKGVLLNRYKTWFSLNEKGEHCEMISMEDCLIPNEDSTPRYESHLWSRFPLGLYQTNSKGFKTHVKTQFLSPSVTYTVNLLYHIYSSCEQLYVDLKYRLRGEATTSVVYLASERKDEYLYMAELYQFTSDGSIVDLEIIFENSESNLGGVEGIMFQPLEKVEDQLLEDDKVEDIETISDSDTYWEQKIPNDYEETLKLSKVSLEWKTKKELYSILCKGFLLDNGQQWFSVDKNGKKWQMLSARAAVIDDNNSKCESSNESRFGEELVITGSHKFEIKGEIKSEVLSPETNYASYLVYKLLEDQSTFEAPLCVWKECVHRYPDWYIYLVSPPHTPIIGPKFDENAYNPLNRYKGTALPQQRTDGWMEVKLWEFQTTTESVPMHLIFEHPDKKNLSGLTIQGIELRPV